MHHSSHHRAPRALQPRQQQVPVGCQLPSQLRQQLQRCQAGVWQQQPTQQQLLRCD
jgi:hypothetical protein